MSQLEDDKKLLKRIDLYGKGLSESECDMLEGFVRWVEDGRALTEKQRRVAEQIDDRRVS